MSVRLSLRPLGYEFYYVVIGLPAASWECVILGQDEVCKAPGGREEARWGLEQTFIGLRAKTCPRHAVPPAEHFIRMRTRRLIVNVKLESLPRRLRRTNSTRLPGLLDLDNA
ncbi:hypothetical protein NDU88_007760 [Pleurodeles waltl]|uniref:Uncharacterized protein n=1 Tax=Pleurodeles waltl TaxID=8319 RepID=A0AAV7U442_PLEWA|nr:hypothetical protein NDU88_007760 [Pleurodeles waltl]